MIGAFTDHLWQSTMFVMAAALVAAALRQNGAHIRHRIWLIASLKFLVPLSMLMSLGAALPWMTSEATTMATSVAPDLSITVDRFAQPFTSDALFPPAVPPSPEQTSWMTIAITGLWACGFAAVMLMRVRGWRRVQSALRASTPVPLAAPVPVRSAPGLLEPGVIGLWRPVLLLPAGIERQLTPRQLETVLIHELCHVQRRDNLTSALHMVVEAVFWFHPLVWFVGARLVDERERACDEYVLRVCGDPATYAESILNVCKLYVESPVACVSGVSGADLKKRIAAILINRAGRQLNLARKAALVLLAILAIALPVVAGIVTAPVRASTVAAAQGAAAMVDKPKFDVVSVKPCEPNAPGQTRGQTSGGGGTPITSPGRLYLQCYPLSSLLTEAYLYFADGRAHGLSSVINVPIEGGPAWMKSERFLIEAKTEQVVPAAVMRGPMLQAVLEDRFKLKIRRVTRDMPVYELVIAKSGAKVSPYTGTDCVIRDEAVWPPAALPDGQRYCGDRTRVDGDCATSSNSSATERSCRIIREGVMRLDELVSLFNFDLPVVNRTGITAPVSYRFEFAREDTGGGEAPRASWMSALRNQLGLDLRVSKGPRDFLVIDHVERPTPDSAFAEASAFAKATADKPAERTSGRQAGPKFDVVSVKPCEGIDQRPTSGRGAAPSSAQTSPGYAYWDCVSLVELIEQAYASGDQPLLNRTPDRPALGRDRLALGGSNDDTRHIRGGPSWVRSDRFTIEVKASADSIRPLPGQRNLRNLPAAMSQALRAMLEDRFQLKVHRDSEPQPMYAFSVAAGGLKIERARPGSCVQWTEEMGRGAAQPWSVVDPPVCGGIYTGYPAEKLARVLAGDDSQAIAAMPGPNRRTEFTAVTMPAVVRHLSAVMDHIVIDKAGVEGEFTFAIEYEKDDSTPGGGSFVGRDWKPKPQLQNKPVVGRGSTIFKAFEQLGLKLESVKGPAEFLVIDSVQRPRPDSPFAEPLRGRVPAAR